MKIENGDVFDIGQTPHKYLIGTAKYKGKVGDFYDKFWKIKPFIKKGIYEVYDYEGQLLTIDESGNEIKFIESAFYKIKNIKLQ